MRWHLNSNSRADTMNNDRQLGPVERAMRELVRGGDLIEMPPGTSVTSDPKVVIPALEREKAALHLQLSACERRREGWKCATWLLLALCAVLLIADLRGCVGHSGDTTNQLPY